MEEVLPPAGWHGEASLFAYSSGARKSGVSRACSVAVDLTLTLSAGEYPAKPVEVDQEFHVSGELLSNSYGKFQDTGKATGLYHLVVGEGQNALVANGLGGTSLINANVFLPVCQTPSCRLSHIYADMAI